MAIFVSVVQTARERSREHLPQTVDDTTYTPSSSPLHANTQTHVLVPHVMCVPQSLCFATLIRCAFATDSYAFEANAIQIVRCTASSMPFDRQKLTIWPACKWMQYAIVSAIENEISSHNSPNATISMHLKFIVVLFHSFAGFNQMEIFEGKMCCRRLIVTGIRFGIVVVVSLGVVMSIAAIKSRQICSGYTSICASGVFMLADAGAKIIKLNTNNTFSGIW